MVTDSPVGPRRRAPGGAELRRIADAFGLGGRAIVPMRATGTRYPAQR
jgi:hypothetical protein